MHLADSHQHLSRFRLDLADPRLGLARLVLLGLALGDLDIADHTPADFDLKRLE